MSRLQQKRVGFKPVYALGKHGKLASKGKPFWNHNPSKKPLTRRIVRTKVSAFRKTLKLKEQIAFDEIVKFLKAPKQLALEDIAAKISAKITKEKGTYFSTTLIIAVCKKATYAGAIIAQ
jgi:hypothetical protein